MKHIISFLAPILLLGILPLKSANAGDLNAKCFLSINGVTRLDDRCEFKIDSDSDYFSDLRILVTCPNGRDASVSTCYGYQQRVTRPGIFGYLFRSDNGVASLCWNEGTMSKASLCYEGLTRNGACWSSSKSRSRDNPKRISSVKFCAWSLR